MKNHKLDILGAILLIVFFMIFLHFVISALQPDVNEMPKSVNECVNCKE